MSGYKSADGMSIHFEMQTGLGSLEPGGIGPAANVQGRTFLTGISGRLLAKIDEL